MNRSEAAQRYEQRLWDQVRDTEYPSPPMLDRLERRLITAEDGEAYVDLLLEKSQGTYPSSQILARIERVADAVTALETLEERAASSA